MTIIFISYFYFFFSSLWMRKNPYKPNRMNDFHSQLVMFMRLSWARVLRWFDHAQEPVKRVGVPI